MKALAVELRTIYDELQAFGDRWKNSGVEGGLEKLTASGQRVAKSWSGSWIGYQSRVYYAGLKSPPPGAHFSSEWGLHGPFGGESSGDWEEVSRDAVENEIKHKAGNPDLTEAQKLATEGQDLLERKRSDVVSILRTLATSGKDTFIERLTEEAEKAKSYSQSEAIGSIRPRGDIMSRDSLAMNQGLWTPPHVLVLAEVASLRSTKEACEDLAKITQRAFSHVERQVKVQAKVDRVGTNVFIGHGRSKEWKDLKDFIKDRMRLPWDEFNRVSVAGIPNAVRLNAMLDSAAIAFLVLTAEDEMADGKVQARMNVVHEAGLFQGRLGFNRAILMLEEGCEEFSNIHGIGQLRFPKGNIRAAFHEVQLVLEREGLIEPPNDQSSSS
jgi:hypothetical protein